MKPAPFHYFRPDTVGEALEQLARYPDAKVMAGGQSLMALMNLRLARPSVIIDIGRLDELKRLFDDTDALILGALVTHRTVEVDPLIGARTPLLAAAAGHIGHIGIRNRGTLGGSVAHADPAAEMPVATLVLGATFHTESARGGRREVAAEDMFVSFYTNALEPDEMITWVSVPAIRLGQGWGFVEYARQHGDYGLAGAGCLLSVDGDGRVESLRAGVLSAADRPLLFVGDDVVGERPSARLWRTLAQRWAGTTQPSSDDPDYSRRLCAEALAQSLAEAQRRIEERQEAVHAGN
ncbi:FAD binding domain-containing protein [Mycolicibacterium lutetiense]